MELKNRNKKIKIDEVNILEYLKEFIPDIKPGFAPEKLNILENLIFNRRSLERYLKKFFVSKTKLSRNYWISRGWTDDEIDRNIELEKKKRLENGLSPDNRERYVMNIEYWTSRGYSEEVAISEIKKRQTTFSKEICISKYGEVEGILRWEQRQEKWIKSISNSKFDTKLNDSKSISFFKERYGDNWIVSAIDKCSFKDKELIKKLIFESKNVDEFIIGICHHLNLVNFHEFENVIKSKIILEYYNTDLVNMKERFSEIFGVITSRYGSFRHFNGHICRSNGEYEIARYLKESNVEYIYEKKYPNSNYICDFYIKTDDLYVEYMGFLKNDNFESDIITNYREKYKIKEEFCKNNNINYLFSSDYRKIISDLKWRTE